MPFDKQNTLGRENTSRMVICKIFGDYLLCGFNGLVKKEEEDDVTIKPSCGCDKKNDPYGDADKFKEERGRREGKTAADKKIFDYRKAIEQQPERPTVAYAADAGSASSGSSSGSGKQPAGGPSGKTGAEPEIPLWTLVDKDEERALCVRVEDISGKTPVLLTDFSGRFTFVDDNECYSLDQKAGAAFSSFTIQAVSDSESSGMSNYDWVVQMDYKGLAFPYLFEDAQANDDFKLTGDQLPVGKVSESIDGIGEQGAKVRITVESAISGSTGTCDITDDSNGSSDGCSTDCQTFTHGKDAFTVNVTTNGADKVLIVEGVSNAESGTDAATSSFNGGLAWTGTDCWDGKTFTLSGKDFDGNDISADVIITSTSSKGDCNLGCTETVYVNLPTVLRALDDGEPVTFCPKVDDTGPANASLCEGVDKRLFYVSKPYELQTSPWNGKPSSNKEVSKYVYESTDGDGANRRVAKYTVETYRCTRGDHNERIDPPYVVGDTIQVRKLIGEQNDETMAHLPQAGETDADGEPKSMARFMVDDTARAWTDDCAADQGQGSIWV